MRVVLMLGGREANAGWSPEATVSDVDVKEVYEESGGMGPRVGVRMGARRGLDRVGRPVIGSGRGRNGLVSHSKWALLSRCCSQRCGFSAL